jgi:hypothetical protein
MFEPLGQVSMQGGVFITGFGRSADTAAPDPP